jgi:hypothetical protein
MFIPAYSSGGFERVCSPFRPDLKPHRVLPEQPHTVYFSAASI